MADPLLLGGPQGPDAAASSMRTCASQKDIKRRSSHSAHTSTMPPRHQVRMPQAALHPCHRLPYATLAETPVKSNMELA